MKPAPWSNPPNPWASTSLEYLEEAPLTKVEVFEDASKSIIAKNDSTDLGFSYSVNPYRGCNHACAYCYARPSHEYLGFGAGTDFDTKIVVKRQAARLLREAFQRPSWKGELIAFSGVTDCYQPLEASLRLTRACLEVCAQFKNPVTLVTKSPLIERDIDVLVQLKECASVSVAISVPIGDEVLSRALEPGVATPKRRFQTIRRLTDAGLDVGVMVAPIIPGISDEGLGAVLEAARAHGATWASYVLLRLPSSVATVFEERLRQALPLRADKVLLRLRQTRAGALYDSRFVTRGRGEGPYADALAGLFKATTQRLGFRDETPTIPASTFQRPSIPNPQLRLL